MTAARDWWTRYNEYLASARWRSVRERALLRDGWRCQRCGAASSTSNPLQAHHLSYEHYNRSGRSRLSDLVTLCSRCHAAVKRERERAYESESAKALRRRTLLERRYHDRRSWCSSVHDKSPVQGKRESQQLPQVLHQGVMSMCVQINVYYFVNVKPRCWYVSRET